jgi:hypothetical protein
MVSACEPDGCTIIVIEFAGNVTTNVEPLGVIAGPATIADGFALVYW